MERPTRVLLVDDDEEDYLIIRDLLARANTERFIVEWAAGFEAAREAMKSKAHDVYLIDYRLGKHNGLDLLRETIRQNPWSPAILLTGQGDYHVDIEAMKLGAADYLQKAGINEVLLERTIRYAIEHKRAEEALQKIHEEKVRVMVETAGAAAHEINQPLSVILLKTEMMLKEETDGPRRVHLETILKAGEAICNTVKKMSTVRRYVTKPYVDDVNILDFDAAVQAERPE